MTPVTCIVEEDRDGFPTCPLTSLLGQGEPFTNLGSVIETFKVVLLGIILHTG